MKKLLTYGVLCFTALILLAIYLISCNTGKEYLSGNLKDASSSGSIVLADLDDDGNPYKGQYKAWDRWVFEHAGAEDPYKIDKPYEEMTREEKNAYWSKSNYPSNWTERKATVLDGKYLIPYEVGVTNGHEAHIKHESEEFYNSREVIYARGVMNPDLRDAMMQQSDRIASSYYMPIPDWLIDNPPKAAMLLPDGQIVTDGLLGSASDESPAGSCCGGTSLYCLYSLSGELLRSNNKFWWFLFHNDGECPAGHMAVSIDGYIRFYNESGELVSIWDYDGTELNSESEAVMRDPHHFEMISSKSLLLFHNASKV